jgi:hypothetical protein
MKKLYIIPTSHDEHPCYTSKQLAEIIRSKKPDVIFLELPTEWNIDDERINKNGQEYKAIQLISKDNNIDIIHVDIPYRNDIAKCLNFYTKEDELWDKINKKNQNEETNKLKDQLFTICKGMYPSEKKLTYEYFSSDAFRGNVILKRRLINKIAERDDDIGFKLSAFAKINDFFHKNIREEIIAYNCIEKMCSYERGVLLIGAEHIGIKNKMKKYSKGIEITF